MAVALPVSPVWRSYVLPSTSTQDLRSKGEQQHAAGPKFTYLPKQLIGNVCLVGGAPLCDTISHAPPNCNQSRPISPAFTVVWSCCVWLWLSLGHKRPFVVSAIMRRESTAPPPLLADLTHLFLFPQPSKRNTAVSPGGSASSCTSLHLSTRGPFPHKSVQDNIAKKNSEMTNWWPEKNVSFQRNPQSSLANEAQSAFVYQAAALVLIRALARLTPAAVSPSEMTKCFGCSVGSGGIAKTCWHTAHRILETEASGSVYSRHGEFESCTGWSLDHSASLRPTTETETL